LPVSRLGSQKCPADSTDRSNFRFNEAAPDSMAIRRYLVLDVMLGLWGVLSTMATGMAVVALVDAGAAVSAALALCRREDGADCDEFLSMANEVLIWPARRALALYSATLLVPFGYTIWRVRYSVPRAAPPPRERAVAATVVEMDGS